MIGKLFADDGANAVLVVVLSGVIAALVAQGPGGPSSGRALPRILANPVPRLGPSGAGQGTSPAASKRRAAA